MCGIAGIIDIRGRWNRDELAAIAGRMADAMPYRGPDDRGTWVSPDGRCALSHRRLSIIDTSPGGHQPFVAPGGGHVITFNGEIYNYQELKHQLEATGHAFRTRSDTEVLLRLLVEQEEKAIERLDGQFAFGLWNTDARTLLLGRDPFGEKPLYWAQGDGWFAFASELHALLPVPGFDPSIDADTIAEYLALQYVDAPRSIYRAAQKLRPGHWLRLDGEGRVRIGRHFSFQPSGGVRPSRPLPELADELEDIMLRLVRRRMIADVPLGAFLSGGVDSSTVVALMTKALGGRVKTFSIGFENSPDETEHLFARQVAEHLGTEHHDRVLELDVLPLLHHIGGVLDEPNGDSSCLPTFLVSKIAKEQVTVCLSGDGGDEMFGGYGRYFATLQDEARGSPDFDAGRQYYSSRMLIYLDEHLGELFGKVPGRTAELIASLRRRMGREPGPLLHKMRAHDAAHYMPGAVLPKVDRMSMQHSLEVRTPFLSRELAAFCEQLAVEDCYRDSMLGGPQGKLVLKELAQRYIPRAWLDRRKMGFGVPTKTGWGKEKLVSWLRELTLGNDSKLSQWIDKKGREAFVQRMAGPHGFSFYQAWLMLVMEVWLRAHPSTRADDATTPALERRSLEEVPTGNLRQEDLLLWRHLRHASQPAVVFCGDELPPWIRELPAGSVVVTPDAVQMPVHVKNVALEWNDNRLAECDAFGALPMGPAVFTTPLREAPADLLAMLQERGQAIVHRVGSHWHVRDAAHATANGSLGGALTAPRLHDRLFGHRVPPRAADRIEPAGGLAWKVALPRLARERALDRTGRIVMFENGIALPHGDSNCKAIASFGRGRFGLFGECLWFSASDNSDPTKNGRRYLVVLRSATRNALIHFLGATPLGRLALDAREGLARLLGRNGSQHLYRCRRPFRHDGGSCWLASLRSMRVPLALLQQGWTAVVLEDGEELPMSQCVHEDVRRLGTGRYSVWEDHVWFSSTDNTNPNKNGRVYSVALVPPGSRSASRTGDGEALVPAIASADDFDRRFLEVAHEAPTRVPRLGPGGKVVMVIGALYAGGAERQMCNLAIELARRGLSVTILALAGLGGSGGHYRSLLQGTGVQLRAANRAEPEVALGAADSDERRLHLLAGLPDDLRDEVWRLFSHIAALQPDVVHCCLDTPNISGGIAGVLADVPRIALGVRSMSPPNFPQHMRPWLLNYYRLLAASPRTALFANSPEAAVDYAEWMGVPAASFRVISNGVDAATLAPPSSADLVAFRQGLGIPGEAALIAGLLRLTEEKQPLLFVRTIAATMAAVPDLHAVLAGTGAMAAEVRTEIGRLGLAGRLHLLGARKDVALILTAADLVLLTSRSESCPNVLLEAQWLGRPVVATRVGGCRSSVLDGETGLLCESQTPQALASACGRLLSDPAQRATMGRRAAQFARQSFGLGPLVERTLAMYRAPQP